MVDDIPTATTVVNGVNSLTSKSLTSKTVASIRKILGQPLNIDSTAHPVINGNMVSENHTLNDGDHLEFFRAGGQKGATVARRNGLRLMIWPNDHLPPHFHAYYQEATAIFSIDPIELMEGSMPKRQRRLIEAWAELH